MTFLLLVLMIKDDDETVRYLIYSLVRSCCNQLPLKWSVR